MPARTDDATLLARKRQMTRSDGAEELRHEGTIDVMYDHLIKYFDYPDEVREFPKGRFEIVTVHGATIGRATYQPGWKWSKDVAPTVSTPLCEVEHLGVVLSGRAVAAYSDGSVLELRPGSVFYIPPVPHDSWVVGDDPYVSLHLQGAQHYSK